MANCPSKLISRIYLVGKSDWRQSCKEERKERKVETEAEKKRIETERSYAGMRVFARIRKLFISIVKVLLGDVYFFITKLV